jgi:hypothetical protein
MYSFMDGKMAKMDKEKTTFISKWGVYAYNVICYLAYNAPTTFQKVVKQFLKKYLNDFMEVFLDNFSVYGNKEDHLQ